jgi:bisphosphoglycerate-dependent phosphoglycerate mutase
MAKPVALTASYPSPERKEKKYAYFRKFTLPTGPKSTFQSVLTILDNFVFPALTDYQITTGLRNLVRLDGSALEAIAPLLLQIVSAAIKNVSFPLKQPIIEDVTLIIAPKTVYPTLTPGKIHRDFLDVDVSGVYAFFHTARSPRRMVP